MDSQEDNGTFSFPAIVGVHHLQILLYEHVENDKLHLQAFSPRSHVEVRLVRKVCGDLPNARNNLLHLTALNHFSSTEYFT